MEFQRSPVILAGKPAVYAEGTMVKGNSGFVWLSGSVGIDINTGVVPEAPGEQAKLALENIKTRLAKYGSSLPNIVHMWLYIKGQFPNGIVNDPRFIEIRDTIEDFWRDNCPEYLIENNPPTQTLLGVTSLAEPDYHLEIMVVAAID